MKRILATLIVTIAALAIASGALASSLNSGHNSSPPASATLGAKVTVKPAAHVAKAGTLPFTGIDLGGVAIGGVALVGIGFALRRSSRRSGHSTT